MKNAVWYLYGIENEKIINSAPLKRDIIRKLGAGCRSYIIDDGMYGIEYKNEGGKWEDRYYLFCGEYAAVENGYDAELTEYIAGRQRADKLRMKV